MLGFAIVMSLVLLGDLAVWLISVRWLRRYRAHPYAIWLCHVFFAVQVAYVMAMVIAAACGSHGVRRGFDWIPRSVQAVLFIWHVVALPLSLLLWTLIGLVMLIRRFVRIWLIRHSRSEPSVIEAPQRMSRRDFLLASIVVVPPVLAVGAGGFGVPQTSRFRVNAMRLPVAGLPKGLEGFTIAQVSDLHVGRWSSDAFLDDVIRRTNALNADVVLFTGDLIDISTIELPRAIAVANELRGRHGLYLIEGNHDLIENPQAFHDAMRRSGLQFLRGQSVVLDHDGEKVQLLGAPWTRGNAGTEAVEQLAQQRDPAAFPILLAHHPHLFDHAAIAGFPLTLSGHTHGGQLALSKQANAGNLLFRYVSGLYQKGNSKLLVSNGTGNWFPLRINAPAEILHITLVSE